MHAQTALRTAFFALLLLLLGAGSPTAAQAAPEAATPDAAAEPTDAPAPTAVGPAAAQASKLHPAKAFPAYESLAFGRDLEALTDYMRKRMEREYRPKMRSTPDVRQRDRLQAEAEKKVEAFSTSHIEFRGQPTGYDVSILSGEFRHNARQEMRTYINQDDTHSYFLLSEGTLWKVVRQQPSDSQTFDELLTHLRGAYGKPDQIEMRTIYREGDPVEVPERVTWTDGTFTVTAADMGAIYKSYTVKWALTDVEKRIAAITRSTRKVDIKARYDTDDILRDVMAPEEDDDVDSIVDRLLDDTAPKSPKPPKKR